MALHRPPVIPEIAKAYAADPKTLLALAAEKAGSSTAPVATGGYGYADGISRILQGALGGYADRKQSDAYGADQDALLALRKQRGVDGLTGAGAAPLAAPPPVVPPSPAAAMASQPPAEAVQAATALGAPAPAPMPPAAPPGVPTAPIPPAAPITAPAMGGGPQGRRPFGPTPVAVSPAPGPFSFTPEAVPAAPAPVARPVAPAAIGPTKSRMLNAAYKIMSDANPYESAGGQDMYTTGLTEQTKLDESATERAQKLSDMGYQTDLSTYASGSEQDRAAAIQERAAAEARNAAGITKVGDRLFEHGENGLKQASAEKIAALERATQVRVAMIKEAGDDRRAAASNAQLTPEERTALNAAVGQGKVDISRVNTRNQKAIASALLANPNLNPIQLHAMANVASNAALNGKAMLAEALPDVLANVRDAGKKLNLSDVAFAGKVQAFAKGQLNDPDFTNYMNKRIDAIMSVSQVMRGTGATDKAVALESEAAPKSMSPRAFDSWYNAQMDQLRPRVRIYEKRGLLPAGTYDQMYSNNATAAPGAYSDPGKEARYQEWLKSHGH